MILVRKGFMRIRAENAFYGVMVAGTMLAGPFKALAVDVSGNLNALVPGDPIFTGVDLSSLTYFHNSNFADLELDVGATLLADDGAGVRMIARNAGNNVLGLNLFPAGDNFPGGPGGNNGEFYELLHNSLISLSPSPDSLLIVHSDAGTMATAKDELAALGTFTTIDEFDTTTLFSTPTLPQLNNYDVVLAYSNFSPFDPLALGNVLADYVDAGGDVVLATYAWTNPFDIEGRIMKKGYSPFTDRPIVPVPDSGSTWVFLGISLSMLSVGRSRRTRGEQA
jgi:hypothetical protein